jgi:PTH1 family peptidyl-tRNA hydrolase
MRVVVGLGNPGKKYENTPHNIGFDVIDVLARRHDCKLKRSLRFRARVGKIAALGEDIFLVKPQTYVNNSGWSVSAVLRYYKLAEHELIVVLDDVAVEMGRIRIRRQGSSGGHNGLRSISAGLGTDAFTRVRVGIGSDKAGPDLVNYVLSPIQGRARKLMDNVVVRTAEAIEDIVGDGEEKAMNEYNAMKLERD